MGIFSIDPYWKTPLTERHHAEHRAVLAMLDVVKPALDVRRPIEYAYEQGYQRGDGISFPVRWYAQLNFQGLKMRHPAGVMHDSFYAEGLRHPLLPGRFRNHEHDARKWDDWLFGDALWEFGCWQFGRATTWPAGLRIVGWYAWNEYRKREREGHFEHILNPAVQRQARLLFNTSVME
jgi:hypothetical protein